MVTHELLDGDSSERHTNNRISSTPKVRSVDHHTGADNASGRSHRGDLWHPGVCPAIYKRDLGTTVGRHYNDTSPGSGACSNNDLDQGVG